MSLPWGVKEDVSPEYATEVAEYVGTLTDQIITLPSGNAVQILKADVKERKGQYLLIMRYQVTLQA